jgi:regulatory protein
MSINHENEAIVKITSIKQQLKHAGRYSIFVDGKYAFSLSETALLESKLVNGQELTAQQVRDLKKLSADDKVYAMALRYAAMRPRSVWEMEFYLRRKQASPALSKSILNKLSNIALLDDEKFARAFVNDRQLLRPTSRRKMVAELRQKHIANDIIEQVVGNESETEQTALRTIITRKRQQAKYQDNLKLMQYLARQGFNYNDIKTALQVEND